MRAYSEDYLFDAMEVLGEAFDCAANRAGLRLGQFFEMFVATGPMRSVPALRAM